MITVTCKTVHIDVLLIKPKVTSTSS